MSRVLLMADSFLRHAGSSGKPVIGGGPGGVKQSISDGHSGFLIDPDDPAEVVSHLELLLSNRALLRTLGEQGRQRARAEFTWDTRAKMLHEIHSELVVQHCRDIARGRAL